LKGRHVIETQFLADSSVVCRPVGSLDWIAAVSVRHLIGDSLRPGVRVVIDLSRVDFIDAAGLSAVVGSVRRVRAVGGRAKICGASGQVHRSLELAGVYRLTMRSSTTIGNDAA
jgi:anti-anti-sigma factor